MKKPFIGRRGQKPGRFFLTALLLAIAIFVLVSFIEHWYAKPSATNGRQASTPATTAVPESNDSLVGFKLFMRRAGCTSGCPDYALMFQRDSLEYIGVHDVKKQGKVSEALSQGRMGQLLDLVEKASFFSLADSYELGSPGCKLAQADAPMLTVGVTLNGSTKVVQANMSCSNVPSGLVELAKGVDKTAGSARWTGIVSAPVPGS